jgi:hypothetical protein
MALALVRVPFRTTLDGGACVRDARAATLACSTRPARAQDARSAPM